MSNPLKQSMKQRLKSVAKERDLTLFKLSKDMGNKINLSELFKQDKVDFS